MKRLLLKAWMQQGPSDYDRPWEEVYYDSYPEIWRITRSLKEHI